MPEMRRYQIEFILEIKDEENDSANTFRSVATDKGMSSVAAYAESMMSIDGQKIIRVHHIVDHGTIVVI
jgi:hypothetical protein